MQTRTFTVRTGNRARVVDLTRECADFVTGDGLLNVFVPHATAGLAIIETRSGQ